MNTSVFSSCFLATLRTLTALALATSASAADRTFIDYVLPMPIESALVSDVWGAPDVLPRDPKNGLEDETMKQWNYWDGQILKGPDGMINHWFKLERPGVVLENGHVIALSLSVLDVPKNEEKGNDRHGSKIIVLPFDGEALDRDLQNNSTAFK